MGTEVFSRLEIPEGACYPSDFLICPSCMRRGMYGGICLLCNSVKRPQEQKPQKPRKHKSVNRRLSKRERKAKRAADPNYRPKGLAPSRPLGEIYKKSDTPMPRYATQAMRWEVWIRDAGQCQYCGIEVSYAACNIDHVVPWPKGKTVVDNLVVACHPCNKLKFTQIIPTRLRPR